MSESKPAVFLDRDGTIVEDTHYPRDPARIILTVNAAKGMRLMREKGYLLFVVSNQSGVGRGIITDKEFQAVHERCAELINNQKVEISEYGYCFHLPEDKCGCRKPQPGLIVKNFKGTSIDLKRSFVIGDKECDVELADAVGAKGILVLTGKGQGTKERLGATCAYPIMADLLAAANFLPKL